MRCFWRALNRAQDDEDSDEKTRQRLEDAGSEIGRLHSAFHWLKITLPMVFRDQPTLLKHLMSRVDSALEDDEFAT
jgi:hypothetical protein